MTRAVFDTNVFLRALLNPHSVCGRLFAEYSARYVLYVSPLIVHEILDVLHRPRLVRKYPRLSQVDMREVAAWFARAAVVTPTVDVKLSRDPDDDKFLACAQAADADFLVTEDNDLLDLGMFGRTLICRAAAFVAYLETSGVVPPQ